MSAIGIGLTLASLAGSAWGASRSAKQNREIDREIAERRAELQGWFDEEMGTGILETESGKSAIKILLENMKRQNKAISSGRAITGASAEETTAQKEKFMENYSNAIAKMLGQDTARKEGVRRDYMAQKAGVENLELQNLQGKSQNWANFLQNVAGLGQSAIMGESLGAFDTGKNFSLQGILKDRGGALSQAMKKDAIQKGLLNIAGSGNVLRRGNLPLSKIDLTSLWSR